MKKTHALPFCLLLLLALGACAGVLPVPGGSDATNVGFYADKGDLLGRLDGLVPGMTEEEALEQLGRKPGELATLKRNEILTALVGTDNVDFKDGLTENNPLEDFAGYRLDYKSVARKHGFSSPVRVRTEEKGFNYTVILIFRHGLLYTGPILSGGQVNGTSSRTFFDFLTPGTVIDHAAW